MSRRALAACAARLLSQPTLLPRGFAASAAPAASLAAQPQPEAPRSRAASSDTPATALPTEAQGPLKPRPWGAESKRTGVLGIKCGMTAEWTSWGERLPLTVVWLDDCQARPATRWRTPDPPPNPSDGSLFLSKAPLPFQSNR
jgi:large subunit ribosomal protein L3